MAYIQDLEDVPGSWLESWRMGSSLTTYIRLVGDMEVWWRSYIIKLRNKNFPRLGLGLCWIFVKYKDKFKLIINIYDWVSANQVMSIGWHQLASPQVSPLTQVVYPILSKHKL